MLPRRTEPPLARAALEDLAFDSISGEVTMRAEDHQLVRPAHLGRITDSEAGVAYEVVATASASDIAPTPSAECVM